MMASTAPTTPPPDFVLLHSGRIRLVAPHVLGAMLFWLAYAFGPAMAYSTRTTWAGIGQGMLTTQVWVALGLFFLPFDLEAHRSGKIATTVLFVIPAMLGWGVLGMAYGQSLPIVFAWVLGLFLCFVTMAVVGGSVVGFVCAGLAEKFILRPLAWLVNVQVIGIDQAAKGEFIKPSRPQNSSPDSLQQPGSRQNTQKSDRPAQSAEKSVEGDAIGFDVERLSLRLDQLAGMSDLKADLLPVLALFRGYAKGKGVIADRNGILLSGPPGNGKTTFAEAIAGELGLPLIKVSGKDIQSKWINESAKYIKALFAQATQEPCVVFFDEFETLAASRANATMDAEDKKVVTALLPAIDAARKQRIVLIAATNYVDQVDSAVMRDGRFDFRIEIPYPDLEARTGILQGMLAKYKVRSSQEVVGYVAKLWERRSVAFIDSAVKRVRDNGVSRAGATVEDFKRASREASRRASAIPKEGAKLSELALTGVDLFSLQFVPVWIRTLA